MDPIDFVPRTVPDGVEVEWAGREVDLGNMLEAGEIAALVSADVPRAILEESPKVGRLFENYEEVERDYYRRTGIFPIMHAVVVKRELAEKSPEVVGAIYQGFCDAKDQMATQYVKGMTFNNMNMMLPWLTRLIGENCTLLGDDWWPYGVRANHAAIDVVLRYHHEQGLTKRRFTIEDVFFPGLLDT
jgi:4,5-dihydroxyphthalate decarboxylase